jgi:cytochrome c553
MACLIAVLGSDPKICVWHRDGGIMAGQIRTLLLLSLSLALASTWVRAAPVLYDRLSDQSTACIGCHKSESAGIYQQWGASKHFRGNVGCFECHGSKPGDAGGVNHNGHLIHVVVTPSDCAGCHAKEGQEFANSHHAKGGEILGSLDNTLAEVVEGDRKSVV